METKKIAVACFIGGALCCAVALMLAPIYWWLGLIAGMAGGYISYEFREVCKAIPVAMRAAVRGSKYVWNVWNGVIAETKAWFSKPHPFLYPTIILTALPYFWFMSFFLQESGLTRSDAGTTTISSIIAVVIMGIFVLFSMMVLIASLIAFFASIGANFGEQCYWGPFVMPRHNPEWEASLLWINHGLRRKPLNYRNLARWFAKGVGITILFFVWTIWKYLAIVSLDTIPLFGRFVWYLFKLIHSEKRVLCAIDGTLGGGIGYIWLASSEMLFPEQAMLVVFCGLLGAAFGVANWEIVSKRILRVAITSDS